MASIDAQSIQKLLDQIDAIKHAIETTGDEGRHKLEGIKIQEALDEIPRTEDKMFDTATWSDLGEDEQKKLHQRLELVCDSLHVIAGLEGPTDPRHIMYTEYASNTTIVLWSSFSFVLTILLLDAIIGNWGPATGTDFTAKIQGATAALDTLEATRKKAEKLNAARAEALDSIIAA